MLAVEGYTAKHYDHETPVEDWFWQEHLKDKDPEYYYSDILIPKKETLGEFIQRA